MSNENLSDMPLITEQIVHCSAEKVWEALTDQDKMRVWYFPQLIEFKPIVGFNFKFADDGSSYSKEWQVLEVVPYKEMTHSWTYIGHKGYSVVRFELIETGAQTKLKVTHTGIASFPRDPHFIRTRFENGWRTILGVNLKSFLER